MSTQDEELLIGPVNPPEQFDEPELSFDIEIDNFIRAKIARTAFGVSGRGLTVAVLDTGLNVKHVDFAGRIPTTRNFTNDDGGDQENASDGNGHGTNVAGLIVANADHTGIAPDAQVIPLKVLPSQGRGSFNWITEALTWIDENHETHSISAVCMSLGDSRNYTDDTFPSGFKANIRKQIADLADKNIAVCIAAGNDFFPHNSQQGMSFPAIIRECISVGAVYDAEEGEFGYGNGAKAFTTAAGQITPFSQRLHSSTNFRTFTDIFAPGAPATSSGINGIHGESTQHGTSQATPVTAGVVLLMQEFYKRLTGELPPIHLLTTCLRRGGVSIYDGDDENDNVVNTKKYYKHLDALSALDAVRRYVQKHRLRQAVKASRE
ncbi:MAG: S8 family peptidase [Candidatus Promineifilaceae bacterium]